MTRRVAVTGLGLCCALGTGVARAWPAALRGETGIRLDGSRLLARARGVDAALPALAARPGAPRRLDTLDRAALLALLAAFEAWDDAAPPLPDPRRAGAILGAATGFGSLDSAYLALYGEGAGRVHPLTVPRVMPSAATSQVSLALGLRGPSFAAASACASASHAIGLGLDLIRSGRLDLAVVGGSEAALVPGVLRGWDALRVLSPDGCRPFSRDRNGIVLGEGAGILVLEPLDQARARGARIHAELAGFGCSADAADPLAPDAEGCAHALRDALRDAALPPDAIGHVNAHATATRLNDRTECQALAAVFGAALPGIPVWASKPALGHALSAAGGLESVLAVLALRDGVLPPTLGPLVPDPDCPVDCVPGEARPLRARAALCSSFAFGGLNAVLAFQANG